MISKLVRGCLILTLVVPMVRAQSVSPEVSAAEKKKARAERDKKTGALVDEIIKELQSLTLPENRIRVCVGLAGSLWPRDEKRARMLFKEAAASLNEIIAEVTREDPEYEIRAQLIRQLRQEMVHVAASYDPRLAIDFLRATRIDSTDRPPNPGLTNLEAQLEMRVAMHIAPKDPNEALAIARDSLRISLDYSALELLYNLHSQQKAIAERFLDDILNAIRTYGIRNSTATPIAITLLRTWIENNRAIRDPAAPRTTANLSLSNLNEQTARELSTMIFDAMLSDAPPTGIAIASGRRSFYGGATLYPGMIHGMFEQLKPIMPDIERFAPDRMVALHTRIVELEKSTRAQQGPWANYQELTQNGTPEALMEAAKTAPSEIVNSLVHQAAWKAINQDEDEKARQIVEQIGDPGQRLEMKKQMARRAFSRAGEQKKVAEARSLLSRLPLEEQVALLAQLAASFLESDKPVALQLLGEAESLIPGRIFNYGQLQALIRVAANYGSLDVAKSAGVIEKVIDQVNELVAAALVLNGFDVQGYFRNGEFIIAGGNQLNNIVQECGGVLASNASRDFDRARSAAERFQRPEMRLIALSQIAQGLLTSSER